MSTLRGRPYHHGNLRRALTEAAIDLLERHDSASVGLREAARAAGVSPAAPYRHFPSREALLAAAAEHGFEMLEAALDTASGPEGDRALQAMGQAYVDFALAHRGLFRLMFSLQKRDHPDLMAAAQKAMLPLARALGGPAGQEARHAAIGAWALVHGLATLMADEQISADLVTGPGRAELVGTVTSALMRGLAAEA